MKEVFEKIIEKFEEYKYLYLVERDSEISQHCKDVVDCEGMDCSLCVFDKAIEIVQQVAEEYDGGWIPCSVRMPEDGVDVLVWFEYFRYGNYNRLFQTIGISYTHNGKWSGFVNGGSGWNQLSIIAWQPLPETYQPKGE